MKRGNNWLAWAGCFTGIAGAVVLALQFTWSGCGFALFLASNMCWFGDGYRSASSPMMLMQVGLTATSALGLLRWLVH